MTMAILRRMEIHRFRNVAPGTKIEFHPHFNVLLGRNGTGKTTLLQWLADVLSGGMNQWDHEPYEVELEIEGKDAQTRVRLKNEPMDVREQLPQRLSRGEADLAEWAIERRGGGQFELDMEVSTSTECLRIHGTPSRITVYRVDDILLTLDSWLPRPSHIDAIMFIIYGSDPRDTKSSELRRTLQEVIQSLQDSYRNACRFDEALDFFSRMVSSEPSDDRGGDRAGTMDLTLLRHGEHVSARGLMPEELARGIEEQAAQLGQKKVSSFSFQHTDLSFLGKAVELFGFLAASMEVSMLEKKIFKVPDGEEIQSYRLGDTRFIFDCHDGSSFTHDHLSYGQKRALAFLYYLASNPDFIIVDELVNGLHHAWIEACRDEIGERQALLTSQNPLLLDHLPISSPEDVRRCFILCSTVREGEQEQLVWRNPTEEEADSFFSAYNAGIQHVGEILMDKGLW